MHITKIKYDKALEYGCDLTDIFKRILSDVNQDLNNLEILINDINRSINDCENKKISSGLGLFSCFLIAAGAVAAAVVTGGTSIPTTVVHSLNIAGNLAGGGIHITNLVKCSEVADELNKILADAKQKKNDIKSIICGLNVGVSNLKNIELCLPKYMYY